MPGVAPRRLGREVGLGLGHHQGLQPDGQLVQDPDGNRCVLGGDAPGAEGRGQHRPAGNITCVGRRGVVHQRPRGIVVQPARRDHEALGGTRVQVQPLPQPRHRARRPGRDRLPARVDLSDQPVGDRIVHVAQPGQHDHRVQHVPTEASTTRPRRPPPDPSPPPPAPRPQPTTDRPAEPRASLTWDEPSPTPGHELCR